MEFLVNLDVDDLERAIDFYVTAFGLGVGRRLGDTAVETAVSAGAELEQPVATHDWGKLALMADPFGHGFCFVQSLGRGYDEITTS